MAIKQTILDAMNRLPDSATSKEIVDDLLNVIANHGSQSDYARLDRSQLTADDLMECIDPPRDGIPIDRVIAELEARADAYVFLRV
ncbi:MAG TPA: hypothetical protein VN641_15375 [Urbifossiella sp.]|nr:hypothetical protein [Urbifossiella sp.]